MSDIDLPGLIVPVEARIDKLEKGLKRASDLQTRSALAMEKRAKLSAEKIGASYEGIGTRISASFKNLAVPFAGGLAGGVVGGIFSAALGSVSTDIRGVIGDLGDLNDASQRIGIDTESLQGLQHGFKLQGVEINDTTAALEKFVDGIGQAAQGEGTLKATFDRAGISIRDQNGKLKSTKTLLKEYADLVNNAPDPASKMALITDAFGRGGKGMVNAMDGGSAAIDAMITKAKEGGYVLDNDLVQEAAALDDKFDLLTGRVKTFFQAMVVHGAEALGVITSLKDSLPTLDALAGGTPANLLGQPLAEALTNDQALLDASQGQLKDMSAAYDDLQFSVTQATRAISDEIPYLIELGDTKTANNLDTITAKMDDLTGRFVAGKVPIEDYQRGMADLQGEARDALEQAQKIDGVDLSNALAGVDRISTALKVMGSWAQQALDKMGQLGGVAVPNVAGGPATSLPHPHPETPRSPLAPETSPNPKQRGVDDFPDSAPVTSGGGGGRDAFASKVASLQAETQALEAQAVALIAAGAAGKSYGDAVEFARIKAQLIVAAQKEGKEITPELTTQINALAQSYVTAGMNADQAADKLKRIDEAGKKGAETLTDLFVGVATGAMTAGEALQQLLAEILKAQLTKGLASIFGGAKTGGFLSSLGGLLGFAEGGFTGEGGRDVPAGIVHRGEFVLSKKAVERLGVANLQGLHQRALQGYAGGGLVGGTRELARASGGHPMESRALSAPAITINAPVTMNATGGTTEQNADLAAQMAKQMKQELSGLVQEQFLKQSRPGGMFGKLKA